MAFFLLLVIVAIVLGIVGVVVKGLLYLLFIGIVVFLGAFILLGARWTRRRAARGVQTGNSVWPPLMQASVRQPDAARHPRRCIAPGPFPELRQLSL